MIEAGQEEVMANGWKRGDVAVGRDGEEKAKLQVKP